MDGLKKYIGKVCILLLLAGLTLASGQEQQPVLCVVRSIVGNYGPEETLTVTLSIISSEPQQGLIIKEGVPSGWTASYAGREYWNFFVIDMDAPILSTITYTLKAPKKNLTETITQDSYEACYLTADSEVPLEIEAVTYPFEGTTFTYLVKPGWNLLGATVTPKPSETRAESQPIFIYDKATGSYYHSTMNNVMAGHAVWLFHKGKSEELTIQGHKLQNGNWLKDMPQGWNLVGAVEDVNISELPSGLTIWRWGQRRFELVEDKLIRGYGYWIFKADD